MPSPAFSSTADASAASRLVYFILGAEGSGRREIARELAAVAEEAGEVVRVLALDAGSDWPEWPEGASQVFLVADGRRNPVDQVEALKPWAAAQGAEVARILCVVNCQLLAANPPLLAWFDACVHFSDVVLLNGRENVPNKWVSDFQKRYAEQFLPCLFELVKKGGRVANPLVVLEPQARRISQYFEADEGHATYDFGGVVIESDDDAGEAGREDGSEGDDDGAAPPEDPYLARRLGGGRRLRELPDIAQYL